MLAIYVLLLLASAASARTEIIIPETDQYYRTRALAFSPDGSFLASSGSDGRTRIWNIQTGNQDYVFNEGYGRLEYSPNGELLIGHFPIGAKGGAITSRGNNGRLYYIETNEYRTIRKDLATFSFDGNMLAVAEPYGATLISLDTLDEWQLPRGWSFPLITSIALSTSLLACGTVDDNIDIWDVASDSVVQVAALWGSDFWHISDLQFSPDSRVLASLTQQ